MKRIFCLSLILLASMLIFQYFTHSQAHAWFGLNPIQVLVDNQSIYFDQPPTLEQGRVLVPLRGVFEAIGLTVQYNPQQNYITASDSETTIELMIGHTEALTRDSNSYRIVNLEVPPRIVKGRTLVPLRFVAETIGANVYWDDYTRTVKITSKYPIWTYSDEDYRIPATKLTLTNRTGRLLEESKTRRIFALYLRLRDLYGGIEPKFEIRVYSSKELLNSDIQKETDYIVEQEGFVSGMALYRSPLLFWIPATIFVPADDDFVIAHELAHVFSFHSELTSRLSNCLTDAESEGLATLIGQIVSHNSTEVARRFHSLFTGKSINYPLPDYYYREASLFTAKIMSTQGLNPPDLDPLSVKEATKIYLRELRDSCRRKTFVGGGK